MRAFLAFLAVCLALAAGALSSPGFGADLLARGTNVTGPVATAGHSGALVARGRRVQAAKHRTVAAAPPNGRYNAVITWYSGHDLLQPYCVSNGNGWAPTDASFVGAVTLNWGTVAGGRPACGSFVRLTSGKNSVVVRIVDLCAGCERNVPHIDLSKAAFLKLYPFDVGRVAGIAVEPLGFDYVSRPYSAQDVAHYGPSSFK